VIRYDTVDSAQIETTFYRGCPFFCKISGKPQKDINSNLNSTLMDEGWRYKAVSITKYDPIFRNEKGHYTKDEWVGFFQIGKIFEDGKLTFESYKQMEGKYIQAVVAFFQFHQCDEIILRDIEKYDISGYEYEDKAELSEFIDSISEEKTLLVSDISMLVKGILRELFWAEIFCMNSDTIACRFGYDFYMYFNSERDMNDLFVEIKELGLYVGR
jgi:hypothetical protein